MHRSRLSIQGGGRDCERAAARARSGAWNMVRARAPAPIYALYASWPSTNGWAAGCDVYYCKVLLSV